MNRPLTAPEVPLAPEDEGRLQLYALLARLFAAGPDDGLLRALAQSAGSLEGEGDLAQAWNELTVAAARTSMPLSSVWARRPSAPT